MKKILFIMHMPPPVHGAAIMGKTIYESKLINNSFECFYINASASENVSDVGKYNLKKIMFLFSHLFSICKIIIQKKPDLCYLTPTSDGMGIFRDALTISILKLLGQKIVLHFHNKGVKNFAGSRFARQAYKIIFSNNKIILLAKELYYDVKDFVKPQNVIFCPNGIPLTVSEKKLEAILPRRESTKQIASLLFLSNIMTEKGVWILIDACRLLKNSGCKFCCNIVGNQGDITQSQLCDRIQEYGLQDSVIVNGPKYGKEKAPFFENANIFVFPTFYHGETFGLVLLEAMEYALPCISTFEGGIPSVIKDNSTGILMKETNAQELYSSIKYLIDNPSTAYSMGINGRERFIENFTAQRFEKNICQNLTDCINN